MSELDGAGIARPGRLEPGAALTVRFVRESGEIGVIVAELVRVFGHVAYGQPIGLLLMREFGEIDGIAGVLDAVPERSGDGRILVLRLTHARDVGEPGTGRPSEESGPS